MEKWKSDLAGLFQEAAQEQKTTDAKLSVTKSEVSVFYSTVVRPALEEVRDELLLYSRQATVTVSSGMASFVVIHKGVQELDYSVMVRTTPGNAYPYPSKQFTNPSDGKTYRSEGVFRSGSQDYTVKDITKEDIIRNILLEYGRSLRDRVRRR